MSHGLKNVADRFDVKVVFSAPIKLNNVCSKIDRKITAKAKCLENKRCHVKHSSPFVECATCVVYMLPLSCGRVYVGQTGRCLNIRLQEHKRAVASKERAHLAQRCTTCVCSPFFFDATVLSRHRDKTTRELIEAFHIKRCGDRCVSHPSIALIEKEYSYLINTLRHLFESHHNIFSPFVPSFFTVIYVLSQNQT